MAYSFPYSFGLNNNLHERASRSNLNAVSGKLSSEAVKKETGRDQKAPGKSAWPSPVQKSSDSIVGPTTSIASSYATEAHVHRIRNALSQADFKHQCRITSTVGRNSQSFTSLKEPLFWPSQFPQEDEDGEDVESVNWTSPFDITTYLYKPEYVIFPKHSNNEQDCQSCGSAGKETHVSNATLPCDYEMPELGSDGVSKGPDGAAVPKSEGQDSMKMEILEGYLQESSSARRRKNKVGHMFSRRILDYSSFAKKLNDEIRELQVETKRLEVYSPRKKMKDKPKEDLIQTGYNTLKKLYELNPDLTESAARKHINGPPGNHWMGLSRVEVLEIMQKIRKELDVPLEKYQEDLERIKFLRQKMKPTSLTRRKSKIPSTNKKIGGPESSGKKHFHRKNKNSAREKNANKIPKLKLSQLPMQHVPGPKHLHTNVCIRKWELTRDGWNQDGAEDDEEEDEELLGLESTSQLPCSCQSTPRSEESTKENSANTPSSSSHPSYANSEDAAEYQEEEKYEDSDEYNSNDEGDYITLEIFNPIYQSSR